MSDPRFARLKSDPRFRRPKTKSNKVVIDERFKSVFAKDKKKNGRKVDKYGRPVSETQTQDNLRRFYRLEGEDDDGNKTNEAGTSEEPTRIPDLARGEVMLESSDEEDEDPKAQGDDSDSDDGGFVTLGRDSSRPIAVHDEGEDAEIDLDEDNFADLDAQAAAYADHDDDEDGEEADGKPAVARTSRLAVVNLDWDHIRAHHLYKICASLVSPTGPVVRASAVSSSSAAAIDAADRLRGKVARSRGGNGAGAATAVRGQVVSVRVYPSDFGKTRMEREEKEGPPAEIFKKKDVENPEEVDERNVYEVGGEDEYDEDALRKYQLERLRYYYAIVICDTVDAASHIYNELEGTELERSANVFDMSFVPEDMTFENEPRDETTDEANTEYKAVEFVTDALRHSKVKLTWDEDDPERNHITRRALTKKEIEDNDFRAYIANTSSESESDAEPAIAAATTSNKKASKKDKKKASRDKLRALLLGGNDDAMPEGWGDDAGGGKGDDDDVDMEITFTPGLSAAKEGEETTLEKYQRKMREKRKKRKEEVKEKETEGGRKGEGKKEKKARVGDEFFEADSEEDVARPAQESEKTHKDKGKSKSKRGRNADADDGETPAARQEATEEELALLIASNDADAEPKHFNLKSVIKAEKGKKHRKGRRDKTKKEDDGEAQEDFVVDVKDERFKVLFEDHHFAIDPTNPHFKKTKAMGALLEERQKRQRELRDQRPGGETVKSKPTEGTSTKSLQSLVESVKRKSANTDPPGQGKRRKLL